MLGERPSGLAVGRDALIEPGRHDVEIGRATIGGAAVQPTSSAVLAAWPAISHVGTHATTPTFPTTHRSQPKTKNNSPTTPTNHTPGPPHPTPPANPNTTAKPNRPSATFAKLNHLSQLSQAMPSPSRSSLSA
jgi:hypothetical protein